MHRVNKGRNAAIRRRRKCISLGQHISVHIVGVRHQYRCCAIDEICVSGCEAGDHLTGGRSLDAVQGEFVVEAG